MWLTVLYIRLHTRYMINVVRQWGIYAIGGLIQFQGYKAADSSKSLFSFLVWNENKLPFLSPS